MSVAIVDYGSGNLHSAHKAFERAAREAGINAAIKVTGNPDDIRRADRIVLPGVGAFADCRRGLDAVPGMIEALEERVRKQGRPFLGICVGMQLLATRGLEHETTEGLGWIGGDVAAISPTDRNLKLPHMGWNTLATEKAHPLLADVPTGPGGLHAYFVHSFACEAEREEDVLAVTEYGVPFHSMVQRGAVMGVQFHPEKSGADGQRILRNFAAMTE